ncbi:hypothetical protein GCM10020219_070280 [Nonomuraea dietziae]
MRAIVARHSSSWRNDRKEVERGDCSTPSIDAQDVRVGDHTLGTFPTARIDATYRFTRSSSDLMLDVGSTPNREPARRDRAILVGDSSGCDQCANLRGVRRRRGSGLIVR